MVSAGKKFAMQLNCIFLTQIKSGLQVCLIDSARKQGYGHKKKMYTYIIRLGDQASSNQLENVTKELHIIVPGLF